LYALVLSAAVQTGVGAQEKTGEELYRAACAACHAADGRGQARSTVGFDTSLPDFTDCGFATPEADADWIAVVHQGGPVRAFDRLMPAFGEMLPVADIQRIIRYVRGFCSSAAVWPRGELNLPRPLVTEKAFPENEAVLTMTVAGGGERAVGADLLYERRVGARTQFEVVVPLEARRADGGWTRGLGDVAVAMKRVLFHSLTHGSILSAAGEVVLPTGSEASGLGKGMTVFEPFVAFGQLLPSAGFLQLQAGVEVPSNVNRAAREAFWRAAIGRTFIEEEGFGRTWSPMVEALGARELESGEQVLWDIVPQMQVTLSRRQHIMISAGARVPLNERSGRGAAVLTYFLWDWFDGGILDGWR
jgi:mono/diheme cytochrome c family protein